VSESLSGCTYYVQNETGEWITGDHVFEENGICFNCGAKDRTSQQTEQQLPVEVVEQGVTANV